VIPGCIVVITEGVRPVGLLTVEEVEALAPDGTPVVAATPLAAFDEPPPPAEPSYRHSTAAARWTSKHASDDAPPQPAGV
jgi:hypothetical protein